MVVCIEDLSVVKCQICQKTFKTIGLHLRVHNLTCSEYKDLYPDAELWSKDSREKLSNYLLGLGEAHPNKRQEFREAQGLRMLGDKNPAKRLGVKERISKGQLRLGENSWIKSLEGREKRREQFSGERNPNWNDGFFQRTVRTIEQDRHWRKIAKQIRKLDDFKCQECGKYGNHVHHIVPYRLGGPDEVWNLITYCASCHGKIEKRIGVVKI